MSLRKFGILSAVLGLVLTTSLTFGGGDGPFPIHLAISNVWVADSNHSNLHVYFDTAPAKNPTEIVVRISVFDNKTQELLFVGLGKVNKTAHTLVTNVYRGKQMVATLRVEAVKKNNKVKMIMSVQPADDSEGLRLTLSQGK